MDEADSITLAHIADAITTLMGDDDYDAVADRAARLYRESPRVAYAALCYTAGSEPRETLLRVVRNALV